METREQTGNESIYSEMVKLVRKLLNQHFLPLMF